MTQTILIIDDDAKLNRLLTKFLSDFGFKAISAERPSLGLKLLQSDSPDLIILDIMLPEMDGFEVLKTIRKESSIPVIMLTARGDLTDKVVGLEIGADDYLAKPFEPRELVARIQSVLRRATPGSFKQEETYGDLVINFDKRKVSLKNKTIELTTNEFTILAFLIAHRGKVMNRDQLLQELSGMDCDVFNRTVDVTVSRLRQKLQDDPKHPEYIKTVWGTGYVFLP